VAPVQVSGPVLTVRRVDAYHALTMVAPGIATQFRPGQFLTVAVGGPDSATLGRRAFSIHDVNPDHGGTVEFIFEADGPGTRWLAGRRSRDLLDVVGPLGRPFPLPRESVSCLLLGAGHGSTALFPLADRLRERGCQIDFMLGAARADRVFGALRARRTARNTVITTEDGSLGSRGIITGMLAQVIHEARTDVIYASAPLPVLREVVVLASRYDLPVQALVEQPTVCGTGVCMSCVLPVVGSDGVTRIVRACTDGPVFRADLVRWDDVNTIPFDALGAPGWKPPHPVPTQDPGAPSARSPQNSRAPQPPRNPQAPRAPQPPRNPQAPRGPQPPRNSQAPRGLQPPREPQTPHQPQPPQQSRGSQPPRVPRPPQARTPQEPRMTPTPRWARGDPGVGHGR
jgi:dihydroorotate dehydrogenase electron transfer subunit